MKENILGIALILFFLSLLIRDWKRMQKVLVKSIREPYEIVIAVLLVIFIIALNIIYPKGLLYIIGGFTVILFIIVDIIKQGLTEDSLIITARGKEVFPLRELSKVEIIKGKELKVKFYQSTLIVTHRFRLEDEELIMKILKQNGK